MIPTNKTVEIYYLVDEFFKRIRCCNQKSFLVKRCSKETEEPLFHHVR